MKTKITPYGTHAFTCAYEYVSVIPIRHGLPVCPAEYYPIISPLAHETLAASAIRLMMETFGRTGFKLRPLCDYCVSDGKSDHPGACFSAEILSANEMAEPCVCDTLPFDLSELNEELFTEFCLAS